MRIKPMTSYDDYVKEQIIVSEVIASNTLSSLTYRL